MVKIAIEVIRAELLAMGIAIAGLTTDFVKDNKVEFDPINNSVVIKNSFFLFKVLCFFP